MRVANHHILFLLMFQTESQLFENWVVYDFMVFLSYLLVYTFVYILKMFCIENAKLFYHFLKTFFVTV